MSFPRTFERLCGFGLVVVLASSFALGFQPRQGASRFDRLSIPDPSWGGGIVAEEPEALPGYDQEMAGWSAFKAAHGSGWTIHVDRRSGVPTLVEGQGIPWFPADTPLDMAALEAKARTFLGGNTVIFKVKDGELVLNRAGSGAFDKDHWNLVFDRVVDGIPVENQRFILYITRGSLTAFGADNWGSVVPQSPHYGPDTAREVLYAYMGVTARDAVEVVDPGTQVYSSAPAASHGGAPYTGAVGGGVDYRLSWRFAVRVAGERGTWVGKVDAVTGDVIAFFDDNKYGQVKGGVYPVSDDGIGFDGTEQPGWPMPYADVTIGGTPFTANDMGIFSCSPAGGNAVTQFAGPYVRVSDTCGAMDQSVTCDSDLDLQQGPGTDCAVPPGASAGDTHSGRSSFYHLNRVMEKGRAWLPNNTWLQSQLLDNVDIFSTCNAYWNGFSVNFYRSGGGCRNTGEIAGVFVHEWGHGIDENDGGGYDNPSEAYADTVAFMQTHVSCVGRGFFADGNCSGYGDACLNCSGIRDQDWNMHVSHTPATPQGFLTNNCGGGGGPCGKEVHCESYVSAEAIWDLAVRDLPLLGLDSRSAWQKTDELWYKSRNGSGGNAYNCSLPSSDGCGAGSWFTKFRTVDDDDGNLSNGTPHASAIFAAFSRHNIACGAAGDASNQSTSSCPSIQTPTLSSSAGSGAASLSWTAVPGASNYIVLRNDQGCDTAFTIIANVAAPGTTYTDTDLPNGFPVYYAVQAQGANTACESLLSNCNSVSPQPFAGTIKLDRATYGCAATINISVLDGNVGASTTTATLSSSTEATPETVILTETPPGSSRFLGSIVATSGPTTTGDGLLGLHDGDLITARYVDADDGQGGTNVLRQTTAVGDCHPSSISQVQSNGISDTLATIAWTTDKASDSTVMYGGTKPPSTNASNPTPTTSHSIPLTGLQQCTVVYYSVQSVDSSGNVAYDNAGGQFYHFETLGNFGSGLQPCHQGRVFLDATTDSCSSTVGLRVIDIDLNANPSVAETTSVTLTSTTETSPETAVLTETGPNTSVFTGSIQTASGAPIQDGKLQLANGDLITATYHDADDGTGQPAIAFATAVGDCAGPAFSSVHVADQPPFRATVTWTTSEPSSSRLDYGSTTALGKTVSDPALVTSHALTVTDLNSCSLQYFKVSGADVYGNTAVDDRGGALYTFESGRVPGAAFVDGFESSSGWSLTGEWEIAAAQGRGGSSGYPDPPSAYSGGKVLGTDLLGTGSWPGDYEPNVSIDATSPTIDCRTLHNATLIIRRWLNVEPGDTAEILGYNHGWTSIWKTINGPFGGGNSENAWSVQRYNVSSLADGYNRFQIRFHLNSNASTQESGWNVDDVVLKDGTLPDQEACGSCANKPSFAGLASATDVDACADTGISLSWPAAASWGSGTSGTYAVYRDTTPNFTPTAANRLVAGLTGTTYTDATAPNATTFYYLVRAENNETCSTGPSNGGVTDDNTGYRSSRDDTSQPVPSDLGSTVRAEAINDVHVRLTWSAGAGAASYDILRADNPRMTGSIVVGHTTQTLFDDTGEMVDPTSRYYLVRGVNACGTEGP